jgi:hypothetical protein
MGLIATKPSRQSEATMIEVRARAGGNDYLRLLFLRWSALEEHRQSPALPFDSDTSARAMSSMGKIHPQNMLD